VRPAVAAVCALLVLSSCGGGEEATSRVAATRPVVTLPSQILGLKVKVENVSSQIAGVNSSYLDGVGLFSFRETDKLLRATLQVSRFNDVAEPEKARFRDAIVAQLGSTVPLALRVGEDRVYLTSGSEQNIFSWFDPNGFYVLSVRSDYPFPRTLLRKLLDADLLR
jgi:hypothetical protein